MGHPCGYFFGTSFSKICNFNREFKAKSFRGRVSIICRSSVAAIYQNKPLSPVSFFNCRNGLAISNAHKIIIEDICDNTVIIDQLIILKEGNCCRCLDFIRKQWLNSSPTFPIVC